ncbi:hypothetical protein AB6A40_010126 [Gnathostoma spinigerum]|uniref:Uncharacterized protein n=1 Tax=Gnathostoma spinigerum TaxID=75299 RepID=A0ABD6F1W1_9BILA
MLQVTMPSEENVEVTKSTANVQEGDDSVFAQEQYQTDNTPWWQRFVYSSANRNTADLCGGIEAYGLSDYC